MHSLKSVACSLLIITASIPYAYAGEYVVDSPSVDEGKLSFEADLSYSADHRRDLDRYSDQIYGMQYGVTNFWSTALSAEIEKTADTSLLLTNLKWENTLAPFKPREYWVDTGLYLNIEKSVRDDLPDTIETKFLFEKQMGDFTHTVNLNASHNFGPNAVSGVDVGWSWRTKYHVDDLFEPGIEYYSALGKLNAIDRFNRQDNVLGPVIQGKISDLDYDAGVLFGLSDVAHDTTVKLNLEYEF